MTAPDYPRLQEQYGGKYVALCEDGTVLAAADTYDELLERLDPEGVDWARLQIEYVEPDHAVGVY
jgi:hypothetical protein